LVSRAGSEILAFSLDSATIKASPNLPQIIVHTQALLITRALFILQLMFIRVH
jgi:hypothetical protein